MNEFLISFFLHVAMAEKFPRLRLMNEYRVNHDFLFAGVAIRTGTEFQMISCTKMAQARSMRFLTAIYYKV